MEVFEASVNSTSESGALVAEVSELDDGEVSAMRDSAREVFVSVVLDGAVGGMDEAAGADSGFVLAGAEATRGAADCGADVSSGDAALEGVVRGESVDVTGAERTDASPGDTEAGAGAAATGDEA